MQLLSLEFLVKVIGWMFVVGPLIVTLVACVHVIIGASKDDDTIKGFVMLGFSLIILGAVMLALVYFTPLLHHV